MQGFILPGGLVLSSTSRTEKRTLRIIFASLPLGSKASVFNSKPYYANVSLFLPIIEISLVHDYLDRAVHSLAQSLSKTEADYRAWPIAARNFDRRRMLHR